MENAIKAKIRLIENLGSHLDIILEKGNLSIEVYSLLEEIRALDIRKGEDLFVSFDINLIHLFDKKSERRSIL